MHRRLLYMCGDNRDLAQLEFRPAYHIGRGGSHSLLLLFYFFSFLSIFYFLFSAVTFSSFFFSLFTNSKFSFHKKL